MKCEKCKKQEATFFYEETINGKTRSYHLCRDCADELQAKGELHLPSQHDDPFSLFLPHQNFLESLFGNSEKSANKYCDKKCSGCGATWEELCSVGKALCPLCYQTFAEELRALVDVPVEMWDERSTTVSAIHFLNETDTRGKKRKNVVDAVAATIILESYLAYRRNHREEN